MAIRKDHSVRLLVPIAKQVQEEIIAIAERAQRTQTWVASTFLEQALESHTRWAGWFERLMLRGAANAVRLMKGKWKPGNREKGEVRVEVLLDDAAGEQLEEFAAKMRMTPVQTAGWLIESGVADGDWVAEIVFSHMGKAVMEWIKAARGGKAKRSPAAGK